MSAIKTTTCPEIVELERLAAGEAVGNSVPAHLAECEPCQLKLASIRENNSLILELARASHVGHEPTPFPAVVGAIPGYRILATIRSGGQGVVYRAEQTKTRRIVALKVLLCGALATARQRARFEREVELVAGLRHPNIVTLFESGTTPEKHPFYAMEYVDGVPLDEYRARRALEAGGTIPLIEAISLFRNICDAVQYAHQRSIVHRDLKPANILIDSVGQPRILDFGLAKVSDEEHLATAMTFTGEFMGTFAYASPEQAAGQPDQIDIRTDVYSLGVIFYELLTGQMPYPAGGSMVSAIRNITEIEPRPPSERRRELGDEIDTIVLKALAKEPARRYQSAGELSRDLQHYLAGEPIDARRDSTWYVLRKSARRYRIALSLSGAFVLFLSVVTVLMTLQAGRLTAERDKSDLERNRAEAAWRKSSIESARLMNASGNAAMAEGLVWPIYLNAIDSTIESKPAGLPHRFSTDPAYWALWEIYHRNPCIAAWQGPPSSVRALVFDKEGRSALISFDDESVWKWNMDNREATLVFSMPTESDRAVIILSRARDCLIRSAAEGVEVRPLEIGHAIPWVLGRPRTRPPKSVFAGKALIAFVNADRAMVVYDLDHRQKCLEIAPPAEDIDFTLAAFSDEERLLVTSDTSGRVQTRIARTGDLIAERTIRPENQVVKAAGTSPAADRFVLATDQDLMVLKASTLEEIALLQGHQGTIHYSDESPDGKRMASVSSDRTVRQWDLETNTLISTYSGHLSYSYRVAWSPNGSFIVTGDSSGAVRMWDARMDSSCLTFNIKNRSMDAICFSPDGRSLVAGGTIFGDSEVQSTPLTIHDSVSGETLYELSGHASGISSTALSRDGRRIVSMGRDDTVRIWDVETRRETAIIKLPATQLIRHSKAEFSADDQRIIAACADGKLRTFDANCGTSLATIDAHRQRIPSIVIHPDGRRIVSASLDQSLAIWDATSWEQIRRIEVGTGAIRVVRYSHQGSTFASGGDDGKVRLWDSESGALKRVLARHSQTVFSLAFSPDDRLLASGDNTGTIQLWDAATGRILMTMDVSSGTFPIFDLEFSPDGRLLAAACAIGGTRIWDLTHFDRHIAGNHAFWRQRLASSGSELSDAAMIRGSP